MDAAGASTGAPRALARWRVAAMTAIDVNVARLDGHLSSVARAEGVRNETFVQISGAAWLLRGRKVLDAVLCVQDTQGVLMSLDPKCQGQIGPHRTLLCPQDFVRRMYN